MPTRNVAKIKPTMIPHTQRRNVYITMVVRTREVLRRLDKEVYRM
jgi:hypothetical protein